MNFAEIDRLKGKDITFEEFYKAPYNQDSFCPIYGFSSNGMKCFSAFTYKAQDELANIIKLLNGEGGEKYDKKDVVVDKAELYIKGNFILVRGWGELTGVGALALPIDKASKIQNGFIDWIVKTITKD